MSIKQERDEMLANNATLTTEPKNKKVTPNPNVPYQESLLDPKNVSSWSQIQVCSLLTSSEEQGGANLSFEKVKPFYDAGFDGISLSNVVDILQMEMKDNRPPQEKRMQTLNNIHLLFKNLPNETMTSIIFWADKLLNTRLYHLWTVEQCETRLLKKRVFTKTEFDEIYRNRLDGELLLDAMNSESPSEYVA